MALFLEIKSMGSALIVIVKVYTGLALDSLRVAQIEKCRDITVAITDVASLEEEPPTGIRPIGLLAKAGKVKGREIIIGAMMDNKRLAVLVNDLRDIFGIDLEERKCYSLNVAEVSG